MSAFTHRGGSGSRLSKSVLARFLCYRAGWFMTARGIILLGLLLCTALLAASRLAPMPSHGGLCEAIEIVTQGAGCMPGYHVFGPVAEPYTWSFVGGRLIVESAAGTRTELAKSTLEIFNCTLPQP